MIRPFAQNIYVKRKYNIDLKTASGNYPIKQKWDGLSQHIAAVIHSNADITILTIFTTMAEVSVYSVYYLVVMGVKRIVQSFNNGLDASFGDMIAKKEDDNMRKKFSAYELLFMIVATIVYSTTIVMITPFVEVYTIGVTDADYYRPLFGLLLVISEYICIVRLPYISLTYAAGHFRETRIGARAEAIVNIVLPIILVFQFGLVGVAIGTIVAMLIRGVEFVYHANRIILKRSVWGSVRKIAVSVLATVMVVLAMHFIGVDGSADFGSWIVSAFTVFAFACVITILLYYALYRRDFVAVVRRTKTMIRKKRL